MRAEIDRLFFACVLFATTPAYAYLWPADVKTRFHALLCTDPSKLSLAIVAMKRSDDASLTDLGCLRVPKGLSVILIDRFAAPTDPWQARVTLEDGKAATMWGSVQSFVTSGGEELGEQTSSYCACSGRGVMPQLVTLDK